MKKVSILIPCYNEQDSLPILYKELCRIMSMPESLSYEWEVLFVNDGSKDRTLEIIKSLRESDKRICYVDLSRNFGKEKAMLAGFDYVTGDCMIIMDADLQDPPSLIPEMLKFWESCDVFQRMQDASGSRGEYRLHDGPPYANGEIHLGHALNKSLKDFIVKYKNMTGYYAPYVPGWDNHGMPIESAIIKKNKLKIELLLIMKELDQLMNVE